MAHLLPWILALIAIGLVAAMPWWRCDPRHEFIFELLRRLVQGFSPILYSKVNGLGPNEDSSCDEWISTTDHHRRGRSRV